MNAVLTPANRNCSVTIEITPGVFIQQSLDINLDLYQNFYKKRGLLQSNQTNQSGTPPFPCSCTARLDRCAVCGGNGTSCVVTIPGTRQPQPPASLPTDLLPFIPTAILNSTGVATGSYNGGAPPGSHIPGSYSPSSASPGGSGVSPGPSIGTGAASTPTPAFSPVGPIPYNPGGANGGQQTTQLLPGQTAAWIIVAGTNIQTLQSYVTLLSTSTGAQVTVTVSRNPPSSTSSSDPCTSIVTPSTQTASGAIAAAEFDYETSSCRGNQPLTGTWYVIVTNSGTVPVTVSVEAIVPPKPNSIAGPPGSSFGLAFLPSSSVLLVGFIVVLSQFF